MARVHYVAPVEVGNSRSVKNVCGLMGSFRLAEVSYPDWWRLLCRPTQTEVHFAQSVYSLSIEQTTERFSTVKETLQYSVKDAGQKTEFCSL